MKERKKNNILDRFTQAVDLNSESLPGLPLVELAGDRRVLIENHHGITEYGCREIHVKVGYGQVCICGAELEMIQMTKAQLVIIGRIDSISLHRRQS